MNSLPRFLGVCGLLLPLFVAARPANDRAHLLSDTKPAYPESLVNALYAQGAVDLRCTVDVDGRARNITVDHATHSDFVGPAVAAMREWRFEPALRGGKPVPSAWAQRVVFAPGKVFSPAGDKAFRFHVRNDAAVPAEFRCHVAPEPIQVADPIYPFELALAGAKGRAKIEFVVGVDGIVSNVAVLEATDPRFGEALSGMVRACRFNPASRKNKTPTPALMTRVQEFGPGAAFLTYNEETKQLIQLLASSPAEIVDFKTMSPPLAAHYQPGPITPPEIFAAKSAVAAVIEFFIDPKGRAQLAHVLETDNAAWGALCASVAQQWWYEPPRVDGRPVFVRMRMPMRYKPSP